MVGKVIVGYVLLYSDWIRPCWDFPVGCQGCIFLFFLWFCCATFSSPHPIRLCSEMLLLQKIRSLCFHGLKPPTNEYYEILEPGACRVAGPACASLCWIPVKLLSLNLIMGIFTGNCSKNFAGWTMLKQPWVPLEVFSLYISSLKIGMGYVCWGWCSPSFWSQQLEPVMG